MIVNELNYKLIIKNNKYNNNTTYFTQHLVKIHQKYMPLLPNIGLLIGPGDAFILVMMS